MDVVGALSDWPRRRWAAALIATVLTLVVIAIPTDILPNPYFTRSMGVTWWSYPVLVINAVLSGVLVASYVKAPGLATGITGDESAATRMGMVGSVATFLAVGCPVCNKLVVLALGVSGAMAWFAPIQPILAVASLLLLAWALRTRLHGEVACRLAPSQPDTAEAPAQGGESREALGR